MTQELPLTDQLALDRTLLANRRTWLASARTGLALFISGASFVKFVADDPTMKALGFAFMVATFPVLAGGLWHFRKTDLAIRGRAQRRLEELQNRSEGK